MGTLAIFACPNHPQWLEKTLWVVPEQSCREFEVTIEGVGSGAATRSELAVETTHTTCVQPA